MAVCAITASAPTRYISCFSAQNDTVTASSRFKLPLFWPWQKVQKVKVGPLTISPMGFGTWAWGNQLLWGYEESMDNELQQVFDLAVDNGVNLFDTADSYGTGRLNGQSEKLLGKFIREYKGKKRVQDDIVIATKFAAYPWRLTPGQFVDACKFHTEWHFRSSLERLQLEKIGIGQLHWSTANYAPLQERALWDGLIAMYEKGLVRAVGVSNYGPKQLAKIHNYLKNRGVPLRTAQVAINWCISSGTIPIPGVKTVQQAQDNLGALGWRLSSNELIELEDAARQSPRKMIQNIFQTR
ncbi:hypothetical protein Cgig2_022686 [Carnegiea gigantea]|uniref:NADP-dependent oxidoreductase domain-containing protein n=1 Tax=Carnegiea gigantea TaxID=171969 RepID=A0A9Q1KBQ4_9CARY|nr:hypothetical protein Cgig2_022686 [Carnegiea gigantea]